MPLLPLRFPLFVAFLIHVVALEWVAKFVSASMQGTEVMASWDVRYLAALTSVEVGVGIVVIYMLTRSSIPVKSSFAKGVVLGVLLLMVQGSLIRHSL